MIKKTALASLLFVVMAQAQLTPRGAPSEYPHACDVKAGAIGVDYLRRSLPTPRGVQILPGILIFEIGVYPKAGESFLLSAASFELDWKSSKRAIGPAEPGWVLASLRHPEWSRRGLRPEISVGVYDRSRGGFEGVRVGDPRNPRFPDDPRQDRTSSTGGEIPGASRVPKSEPHPDELPERIVSLHALPREPMEQPSAGYIYFPYDGKLKKLKQLTMRIHLAGENCEFSLTGR